MKFLDFEQFNESFIEDIFRSAHAAISKEDLIPLKKVIGKPKCPTKENVHDAVDFLKIDPACLYYNPSDFLHPVVYWKGPFFYGFTGGLQLEALKFMHADKYFEHKKRQFEEILKRKNYEDLFHHVDKKILIPTFVEMYDEIPDNQKYNVFTDLYTRSEFGFGMFPKEIVKDVFAKRELSNDWKKRMQNFKRAIKKNEDGTITVYRGEGSKSTPGGMSWTLDRKTAKFFADRFGANGKIKTKKVNPEEVLDYLNDRGESEVLIKT